MNRKQTADSTGDFRREPVEQTLGKLVLRLAVGGLMLFHGVAKLRDGIEGVEDMVAASGLPTFLAYGVYVGEVIAPLLLILGLWSRIAGVVFAFNMLVAILLGHSGELLSLNQHGGWAIELPLLYLLGAVCVTLLGPGRFSLGRSTGYLA